MAKDVYNKSLLDPYSQMIMDSVLNNKKCEINEAVECDDGVDRAMRLILCTLLLLTIIAAASWLYEVFF